MKGANNTVQKRVNEKNVTSEYPAPNDIEKTRPIELGKRKNISRGLNGEATTQSGVTRKVEDQIPIRRRYGNRINQGQKRKGILTPGTQAKNLEAKKNQPAYEKIGNHGGLGGDWEEGTKERKKV